MILWLLAIFSMSSAAFGSSLSENASFNNSLRWKSSVIPITFSNSILKANLNIKPDSDIKGALSRSLDAWQNAADVKFEVAWSDKQTVSPKGGFGDGVSLITIAQTPENLMLFSRDATDIAAQTRVFFNKKGIITEADIALNPYQQFSTDGTFGTFDLETTLTHEIGHLLGLRHSPIWGDAMHADKGRNGVFNLNSFDGRILGASDVSAVRGRYGVSSNSENCCGKISGAVTADNLSPIGNLIVWAEEADGGRTAGQSLTNAKGNFSIDGLPLGKYKVFSQNNPQTGNSIFSEELGIVEVKKDGISTISKKIVVNNSPQNLSLLGFNGQLSEMSVALNGGKFYTLYLGGKHLNPSDLKVIFHSPYFKIVDGSTISQDFGTDLSVVSLTVEVGENVLPGEYSLSVLTGGQTALETIPGAVKITDIINPWQNYNLTSN